MFKKNFPTISFQSLEHYRMEYGDNIVSVKLVSNMDGNGKIIYLELNKLGCECSSLFLQRLNFYASPPSFFKDCFFFFFRSNSAYK